MSSKSGAPRHQNAHAWTVNKHSPVAQRIAAMKEHGLCSACLAIIDWRKRMGRYKQLNQTKKCVECSEKRICAAYHVLCKPCAQKKQVCEKCMQVKDIIVPEDEELQERLMKSVHDKAMASMNERERRSYKRKIEKELVANDDANQPSIQQRECHDE